MGLIFTIFIFLGIKKIKQFYFFTARVPENNKKLRYSVKELNGYYSNYENNYENIDKCIAKIEVVLNWLKRNSSKDLRGQVKKTIKNILLVRKAGIPESQNKVWDIYIQLSKINEEVGSQIKDNKWM